MVRPDSSRILTSLRKVLPIINNLLFVEVSDEFVRALDVVLDHLAKIRQIVRDSRPATHHLFDDADGSFHRSEDGVQVSLEQDGKLAMQRR